MPTSRYKDKVVPIQREKEVKTDTKTFDGLLTWAEIVDRFDVDMVEFTDKAVIIEPIDLKELGASSEQIDDLLDILENIDEGNSVDIDRETKIITPKSMSDHRYIFSALDQVGITDTAGDTEITNHDDYDEESTEIENEEEDDSLVEEMSPQGVELLKKALQGIADGEDIETLSNSKVSITVKDLLTLAPEVQDAFDSAKTKHKEYTYNEEVKSVVQTLEKFVKSNTQSAKS